MSSEETWSSLQDQLIENRFEIGKLIGKGSFGEVYEARDIYTENRVAVKFEIRRNVNSQLKNEYQVYQIIAGDGVPKTFCYGSTGDYDYLVMELLGPSLEKLFTYCRRKFTLKTVLMLGEQMIRRVESVHQMSHIHRDIKPDNFVLDLKNGIDIYLIDFGLARRYCQTVNNQYEHMKQVKLHSFTGTARYASITAQQQFTTSRKDDLESLAYIMVYFLKGRLPWQQVGKVAPNGLTAKQRKERILEIKMSTKVSDICDGIPNEFQHFIHYCRNLKFDEAPSYAFLRRLLRSQFERSCFEKDWVYDWNFKDLMEKRNKTI